MNPRSVAQKVAETTTDLTVLAAFVNLLAALAEAYLPSIPQAVQVAASTFLMVVGGAGARKLRHDSRQRATRQV